MPSAAMPFFVKATLDLPYADGADNERRQLEDKHSRLIYTALRKLMQAVAPPDTTVRNITPDIAVQRYRDNQGVLRDALVAMLTDGAMLGADVGKAQNDAVMGVGVRKAAPTITGVDWDLINGDVLQWVTGGGLGDSGFGQGYADTLATAMAGTSERGLRTLVGEWVRNDLTYRQLVIDLERSLFSRSRAEMVVSTEITRAYAEGNRVAWQRGGIIEQMQWQTAGDERRCPVCAGMQGQIADVRGSFGSGLFPPAHVRCRCFLSPYIDSVAPATTPASATPVPANQESLSIEPGATDARNQLQLIGQRFADRIRIAEETRTRYERSSADLAALTRRQDAILVESATATPERQRELAKESRQINKSIKDIRKLRDTYVSDIAPAYAERSAAGRQAVYVADPASNKINISDRVETVTPEARQRAIEGLAEFNKLVSRSVFDGDTINYVMMKPGWRANYDDYFNEIRISPTDGVSVVIHELAHGIEYRVPGITEKTKAFFERRTQGEQWQSLRELTGNQSYRDDEEAKPDRFITPYIGKNVSSKGTEIITMGLQYMYEDPVRFAQADPDMFDFIYNLVRGR